jgi:NifU-like protein
MWEYSDKVKEHFFNPHNVGQIENADIVVEVGSAACGDALKLFLKMDGDKIIDAKFQTFGCGSAIASSSVLTDLIKGKTVQEAEKITNEDVVNLLGGLPKEKIHCSVMAEEALEKAVRVFKGEKADIGLEPGEKIVCHCFNVTNFLIEKEIKAHNLTTVDEVTNYTKAGGACGKCREEIQGLIDDYIKRKKEGEKMTNLERIELIKKVIDEDIRPGLMNDGGDIELVDVEGNQVKVRLKGACSGCPMATMTLKNFVEETLKNKVSNEIELVEA